MQNDTVTWEILGKGRCSFKKKTITQMFCMNEYNVTGLCTKVNCPLSNSVYGTVILDKGKIYLYLKCPEREHLPSQMWSRVLLSLNRKEAFNVIYKEMKFTHSIKQIKKCMKRYTRMKEILKRSRRLILQKQAKLVPIKKKTERRDRVRENKALKAANILSNVETELLNRLNSGLYGNLYKFLTPKKKFKNKESELSKIFREGELQGEELQAEKKGKKKEKEEEYAEEYEEDDAEEHVEDDGEEYEEEDDGEEYEEEDDGEEYEEEDDDEEYEEEDDDEEYEEEDDGEEYEEEDDDEEYEEEDDDEKYEEDETDEVKRGDSKRRRGKRHVREYVDNEYIKTLQDSGKLFDDEEMEYLSYMEKKKRKKEKSKQAGKKKIPIVYEND
ncbi:MAK16-related protein [Plasmodium ovale curtisi]|uniref:MAK16-related protein n=1 Tax=Plasmodium ovale curtisi TaxID=864141 RepID=A0A1A8VKM2_PLAOA|nr:MAK16-related protein [Plasmodium ovale curtisi]SBS82167.1 MAK16-related protein [Plasmodium ovale curtisi]